jgi:hypothetical protein
MWTYFLVMDGSVCPTVRRAGTEGETYVVRGKRWRTVAASAAGPAKSF